MAQEPPGDPRLAMPQAEPADIRPIVVGRSFAPSALAIGLGLTLFGVLLFLVLDSRRRALETPAVRVTAAERARMAASEPPPLYVPPAAPPARDAPLAIATPQVVPFVLPEPPTRRPRIDYMPQQPVSPMLQPQPIPMPPHELTEGVGVALHVEGEEIPVAHVAVSGAFCHRTPSLEADGLSWSP